MPQDYRDYYKTTITIYSSDESIGKEDGEQVVDLIEKWFSGGNAFHFASYDGCVPCKIEDMPKGIRGEMRNWDRTAIPIYREIARDDWKAGFKNKVPQGFTFKDWEATGFTDSIPDMLEYMQRKEEFMANVGKESENASN